MSKLSLVVDSNGIPLSALLEEGGNISDQTLLFKNLDDMFIKIDYLKKNNKHKRYMLADAIYDTKNIRNKIKELNIKAIIPPNIKNTKDKNKIKQKKLNKYDKKIYKKRIIIENHFSWLYKNRRISRRYDKNVSTYMSFLFIAFLKIIIKRMN